MALVTEDGTGKADAESFISVADADSYFSARGDTVWTALDTAAKEAALRKATDYMGAVYGLRWAGSRVTETQALDWPRDYVPRRHTATGSLYLPDDEVPQAVQRACAELAVRASAGDLLGDVGAQVKQETVGPISVTYADGARQTNAYKAVDALLAPYLSGAGQVPVVRA